MVSLSNTKTVESNWYSLCFSHFPFETTTIPKFNLIWMSFLAHVWNTERSIISATPFSKREQMTCFEITHLGRWLTCGNSLKFQTWGGSTAHIKQLGSLCHLKGPTSKKLTVWNSSCKVQSHYSSIYDKNGIFLPKKGGRMQTKKIEDQVIFVLVIVMVVPLVFYNK